jgi:hypothetical protein
MSWIRRLITLALILPCAPVLAHPDPHAADNAEQPKARVLGRIEFPTTTRSEDAQEAFVRGVLLLHLFEYPFAGLEFQRAQQLDPDFLMAYWGEAMVHNHPVWDEQDRDQALVVLNKLGATSEARAARTMSQKERDYIRSLEVLYGEGTKAERDRDYNRYMAEMAQRYPDDHEVRLFHALSILGAGAGVRDIPGYMESTALSQSVFYANRQHPGAAHYLIHGVDDPVHAPLGLEAARALAVMAPDAGHSLHMASHIFTALGRWDDVVNANTRAVQVENAMAMELGKRPGHWGHYNFWLLYGLLQQGRDAEAKTLLTQAYQEAIAAGGDTVTNPLMLDPDNSQLGSVVQMWARYMIETGGADAEVAAWKFDMGEAYDPNLSYHYVRGLLSSDPDDVAAHLSAFRSLKTRLKKDVMALSRQAPFDLLYLDRLVVIEHQLEAMLARARGDTDTMMNHAHEASRLEGEMPYSFGPPFVDMPSAQLWGELSLELGSHEEAAAAFAQQLKRSRLKAQALLGLARAERARGNVEAADYAMARYQQARAVSDRP